MEDYISRKAEKNAITDQWWEEIDRVPAADVCPVMHGHWHKRYYYRESTNGYDCEINVCSKCGFECSYDNETGIDSYRFCPNCGAQMDGGDK